LATVIPFTHHDINVLQYGKGTETLNDVMNQKGLGQKPGGDAKSDPLGIR
jgi:hypothetical protein